MQLAWVKRNPLKGRDGDTARRKARDLAQGETSDSKMARLIDLADAEAKRQDAEEMNESLLQKLDDKEEELRRLRAQVNIEEGGKTCQILEGLFSDVSKRTFGTKI